MKEEKTHVAVLFSIKPEIVLRYFSYLVWWSKLILVKGKRAMEIFFENRTKNIIPV